MSNIGRIFSFGPVPAPKRPEPIFYFTIGLSHDPPAIVMIGISKSRWAAQAKGIERMELEPSCATVKVWDVFRFDDGFGERFRDWLMSNGVPRADITSAIREFGKVMIEMMEDAQKQKGNSA